MIISIPPRSGDRTAAIQKAIDKLDTTGAVELSGEYIISQPLDLRGVRLFSSSEAWLHWQGPRVDDYMLRCSGPSDTVSPRVENLNLRCYYRCRGLLLSGQTYCAAARGINVWHARQVGIDVIDCWGSSIENCYVDFTYTGHAMRFYRFNGSSARQIRCRSLSATRANGDYSSAINYAMEHGGLAAAEEEFGDVRYDWPAADDEACTQHDGRPWRPGERAYSALYLENSTGAHLDTVLLEGCYVVDWPLAKVFGSGTRLENLYVERCSTLRGLVELQGSRNSVRDMYVHPLTITSGGYVNVFGEENIVCNVHH